MKKTGKRIALCLLAVLLILIQVIGPVSAASDTSGEERNAKIQEAANALYSMGLIEGVGTNPDGTPNFNLGQPFTRGEGVAIIVILIGAREKATSGSFENPYTDNLGWAEPFVLYATANNLVSGTGDGAFRSGDPMDIRQFLVMVLRMLGYWDGTADWKESPNLSRSLGADVPTAWNQKDAKYTRGDAILACYSALDVLVGDPSALTTFRYTMEKQGLIASDRMLNTGFTWAKLAPTKTEMPLSSLDQMQNQLFEAIRGLAYPITIRCPGTTPQDISNALAKCTFAVRKTSALGWPDRTELSIDYLTHEKVMSYLTGRTNVLDADARALMNAALQLHSTLVNPSMDEYAQVIAFHDYIVYHTRYSTDSKRVGTLTQGIGVCEDYSMTFQLLCWLSGIECMYVTGDANSAGDPTWRGHAWNKVKVNGNWYNIDVTYDDPVLASGDACIYDYFLKSDAEFSKDHQIDPIPYWPASPSSWTW